MQVLLIFVRNPELGKVKTRLAKKLGDESALEIYRFLLARAREASLAVEAERWLFYSESIPERDDWAADQFHKALQSDGGLGERMSAAFRAAFDSGAEKAIIMGSDCPDLNGAMLQAAFAALDQSDLVIGPAGDGGYYLLGMKQFEPAVFQNIAWSTETVCADTEAIVTKLGKTITRLPVLHDIDEAEDWARFCERAF